MHSQGGYSSILHSTATTSDQETLATHNSLPVATAQSEFLPGQGQDKAGHPARALGTSTENSNHRTQVVKGEHWLEERGAEKVFCIWKGWTSRKLSRQENSPLLFHMPPPLTLTVDGRGCEIYMQLLKVIMMLAVILKWWEKHRFGDKESLGPGQSLTLS